MNCEHGIKDCSICNKREGDCDFGGCSDPATHRFEYRNSVGIVTEVRCFCEEHGTDPRFAFVRPKGVDPLLRKRLARRLLRLRADKVAANG